MTYTAAGTMHTDPRIAEAKELLLQAVKDQQSKIEGVRPGDPALKEQYEKILKRFGQVRGNDLWYPYLGSGIGKGALVELLDGSVKYDFICGIGVHHWGHSHPDILSASIDGALSDMVMQGHLQQNADTLDFSEILLKASGLDHCFLTTSGAMANENALKIAFQKHYPKNRIIAFDHNFAGRSYTFSQVTDKPAYRDQLPLNLNVDYIPFYDWQRPEESTREAVRKLEEHLSRYPKQHALFIFEPIQGEGGFYPGTHEFFKAILEIVKKHDICVLADECQSFGRTPSLFASHYFGLQEYVDMINVGKLAQVCATLWKKEYNPRPGLLAQTFTGSSTALHSGKVIIQSLLEQGFLGEDGKLAQINARFVKNFEGIMQRHPGLISGPFGIGSMIAFTPYEGDFAQVKNFSAELFDAGVIAFICGMNPTRIRMLVPAGAITFEDIDAGCKIIEETLIKCR